MKKLYLTIDDAPSANTERIVDFLDALGIQALFFCRGDRMAAFPGAVDALLRSGHWLGAHGFSHQKASRLSPAVFRDEVRRQARMIEAAYDRHGLPRRKYFRFPYFDKGSDSFPCDPTPLSARRLRRIRDIMQALRADVAAPSPAQLRHKERCQRILRREGYAPGALRDDLWDDVDELKNDCDVGASLVTMDWTLLPRHRARSGATVETLCRAMEGKLRGTGTAIVLMHDYDDYEGAFADFRAIVHFLRTRAGFLPLASAPAPAHPSPDSIRERPCLIASS